MLTQETERELQNFRPRNSDPNHPADWNTGIWPHRRMYVDCRSAERSIWGGYEIRSPKILPGRAGTGWFAPRPRGPAIYAALALKGFFPMEWMETLNQPGTNFTQPL